VNVPGVTAIVVAPVAAQVRVLLAPEVMLAGFAVNELIVGAEPFPDAELDELVPHPSSPTQTARIIRTRAQRCTPEELNLQSHAYGFPQRPFGVEIKSLEGVKLFGCIPNSLLAAPT
jgi:hypothetical protein